MAVFPQIVVRDQNRRILEGLIPRSDASVHRRLVELRSMLTVLSDQEVLSIEEDLFGSLSWLRGSLSRQLDRSWLQLVRHDPAIGALTRNRKRLLGAFFTTVRCVQGAGVMNPSVVPYREVTGADRAGAGNAVEVVMSLRSLGGDGVSR